MKTLKLLTSLLIATIVVATATKLGANPFLVVGILALLAFLPMPQGVLRTSLDITALNTTLGAYFRKSKTELLTRALMGMDIDDRITVWDDCKDEVPIPRLFTDDLVKPANDTTFAASTNALDFSARILKVRRWKVDLLLIPGALEKSWLGAYKKKGSDAYDMPFEEYVMREIITRVNENIRMKALFGGTYNAAGTAPVDIMDGLKKIIADEITATTITPVVTGALTSANVVDNVYLTYDDLDEAVKAMSTQMLMSPSVFDMFVRKWRSLYGSNNNYGGINQNEFQLDGTNCMLKREPGLGTSQRLITTTKSNIIYGVDSLGEENDIKSQVFERSIKLMIDAKSGVNFADIGDGYLAVNDQV